MCRSDFLADGQAEAGAVITAVGATPEAREDMRQLFRAYAGGPVELVLVQDCFYKYQPQPCLVLALLSFSQATKSAGGSGLAK